MRRGAAPARMRLPRPETVARARPAGTAPALHARQPLGPRPGSPRPPRPALRAPPHPLVPPLAGAAPPPPVVAARGPGVGACCRPSAARALVPRPGCPAPGPRPARRRRLLAARPRPPAPGGHPAPRSPIEPGPPSPPVPWPAGHPPLRRPAPLAGSAHRLLCLPADRVAAAGCCRRAARPPPASPGSGPAAAAFACRCTPPVPAALPPPLRRCCRRHRRWLRRAPPPAAGAWRRPPTAAWRPGARTASGVPGALVRGSAPARVYVPRPPLGPAPRPPGPPALSPRPCPPPSRVDCRDCRPRVSPCRAARSCGLAPAPTAPARRCCCAPACSALAAFGRRTSELAPWARWRWPRALAATPVPRNCPPLAPSLLGRPPGLGGPSVAPPACTPPCLPASRPAALPLLLLAPPLAGTSRVFWPASRTLLSPSMPAPRRRSVALPLGRGRAWTGPDPPAVARLGGGPPPRRLPGRVGRPALAPGARCSTPPLPAGFTPPRRISGVRARALPMPVPLPLPSSVPRRRRGRPAARSAGPGELARPCTPARLAPAGAGAPALPLPPLAPRRARRVSAVDPGPAPGPRPFRPRAPFHRPSPGRTRSPAYLGRTPGARSRLLAPGRPCSSLAGGAPAPAAVATGPFAAPRRFDGRPWRTPSPHFGPARVRPPRASPAPPRASRTSALAAGAGPAPTRRPLPLPAAALLPPAGRPRECRPGPFSPFLPPRPLGSAYPRPRRALVRAAGGCRAPCYAAAPPSAPATLSSVRPRECRSGGGLAAAPVAGLRGCGFHPPPPRGARASSLRALPHLVPCLRLSPSPPPPPELAALVSLPALSAASLNPMAHRARGPSPSSIPPPRLARPGLLQPSRPGPVRALTPDTLLVLGGGPPLANLFAGGGRPGRTTRPEHTRCRKRR